MDRDWSDCIASKLFDWLHYFLNCWKYWKKTGLIRDLSIKPHTAPFPAEGFEVMTLIPFAHWLQTMKLGLFFSLLLQLPFLGDLDLPAQNKLNQTCPGPSYYQLLGVHLNSYITITLHLICSQNLAQHFCLFILIVQRRSAWYQSSPSLNPPAVCPFAGQGMNNLCWFAAQFLVLSLFFM